MGIILPLLCLSLCCLSGMGQLYAMDVSPYKVDQVLTAKQAEELKKRYAGRSVQEWKVAPDKATINGITWSRDQSNR